MRKLITVSFISNLLYIVSLSSFTYSQESNDLYLSEKEDYLFLADNGEFEIYLDTRSIRKKPSTHQFTVLILFTCYENCDKKNGLMLFQLEKWWFDCEKKRYKDGIEVRIIFEHGNINEEFESGNKSISEGTLAEKIWEYICGSN